MRLRRCPSLLPVAVIDRLMRTVVLLTDARDCQSLPLSLASGRRAAAEGGWVFVWPAYGQFYGFTRLLPRARLPQAVLKACFWLQQHNVSHGDDPRAYEPRTFVSLRLSLHRAEGDLPGSSKGHTFPVHEWPRVLATLNWV